MIRLLIADDHTMFRQGLTALFGTRPDVEVVATAADGQEALAALRRVAPDVAVVDVSMPPPGGLELVRLARRDGLATRFIVLTMYADPELARRALDEGAAAFVVKDGAFEDLAAALAAATRGTTFVSPVVAMKLVHDKTGLTTREREIVTLIAQGRTSKEIAVELGIAPKTVEAHRASILKKLALPSAPALVRWAVERGLVVPRERKG